MAQYEKHRYILSNYGEANSIQLLTVIFPVNTSQTYLEPTCLAKQSNLLKVNIKRSLTCYSLVVYAAQLSEKTTVCTTRSMSVTMDVHPHKQIKQFTAAGKKIVGQNEQMQFKDKEVVSTHSCIREEDFSVPN